MSTVQAASSVLHRKLSTRQAAAEAVASLIRNGDDIQALFRPVFRLVKELDKPMPGLERLALLLLRWDGHSEVIASPADREYWQAIGEASELAYGELFEYDQPLEFAAAEVLLAAIRFAADFKLRW